MTASLALYEIGTRLLEPAFPYFVRKRLREGKERPERMPERFGMTDAKRPNAKLIWMHGASVGESRLLLDLFAVLRQRRPGLQAVITTQTLTSADMIADVNPPGVRHQMAPIDAPGAVERFLDHWRPDAAVFAEGEIWPNMLQLLRRRRTPAALVNASMTQKTLANWRRRATSAQELFSSFSFIGAADAQTAISLMETLERPIAVVGNLKRGATIEPPPRAEVEAWREQAGSRPIMLAASTHPTEDEIALDAYQEVRLRYPGALLIIVPRHPERGKDIVALSRGHGFTTQLRSEDKSAPNLPVDVLVADTIGELKFFYAVADAVYLGGASKPDVGGHNAMEPAQLGKRVFTGPNGFKQKEMFEQLAKSGAVVIGGSYSELADFWSAELANPSPPPVLTEVFAEAGQPFEASIGAILAMLPQDAPHPESGNA